MDIPEQLNIIRESVSLLLPELVLSAGVLLSIVLGMFKKVKPVFLLSLTILVIFASTALVINDLYKVDPFFQGMMQRDSFTSYIKILMGVAGLLTCVLWLIKQQYQARHVSEYFALIMAAVLGGFLLVMSNHFLMIFLSLEIISISSYILAGYAGTKSGSEGSLKYFLFGAVASAIMLYGFSILYGITGTLDFTSQQFSNQLIEKNSALPLAAGLMALAGFLYKIGSAPMHLWAPDVYEAAPIPVVAFLSVAPKLAGIGILTKFILAINLFGQSDLDWQIVIAIIAMLTLTIGNFSALAQKDAKRMMAYSSIAQSGFLLAGVAAFLPQGIQFLLFYASIYVLMNFTVFLYLEYFEMKGINSIAAFSGAGKTFAWPIILLLTALIALTGLPPTAGFTAKLFIFSALWESYQVYDKPILLWLLIFGLLNTVVSLFYYLKIPYYAFLKTGDFEENRNNLTFANLLGFVLVLLILVFFFLPGLLMGWINKINFVL